MRGEGFEAEEVWQLEHFLSQEDLDGLWPTLETFLAMTNEDRLKKGLRSKAHYN